MPSHATLLRNWMYSLSHVISNSVINIVQVRYQNLTFLSLPRNTQTENCQPAVNGPDTSWPGGRSRAKQRALFADIKLWCERNSRSEAERTFDRHILAPIKQ